ncbi:30449_t:CDS:2, partial [Racocetra persica]
INKALKSLIPPIPSQRHWEIAACNCTKFLKLRTNLFNIIGYSEKKQFINSSADNCGFQNISRKWMLSEEMKRFSEIAHMKRIELIKAKLINKTALDIWHPIPIT